MDLIKTGLKLVVTSLFLLNNLYSEDGFDDEDEFGSDEVIEIVKTKKEQKGFGYYGSITYSNSYNYSHKKPLNYNFNDFRGFSSSKLSIDVNLEYKLKNDFKIKSNLKVFKDFIYDLKDDDYKIIPKDYDEYTDINEFYFQGSINSQIDFKIGRQIIVWGKSDNIRITDTLNPMDYSNMGMVDIKDLRLGKTISKIDYFIDKWALTGIILHENRFSKMPKYGSDYAPANKIIANKLNVKKPSNSFKNSGIALSLNGNLEGQDLSFYYSNQYLDNTNYKSNMLGFAYNKVIDNFLFKTELAYFDNYDDDKISDKIDSLIGFEYNGIDDGSFSLEIANKNNDIQYAVRFTQSYINQTLDFTTLYNGFGKDVKNGGFIRSWFDYAYNDTISINFGMIDYLDGDDIKFKMLNNNDRIFGNLKFNF